jgi:hypothetical protein
MPESGVIGGVVVVACCANLVTVSERSVRFLWQRADAVQICVSRTLRVYDIDRTL